MGFFGPTWCFHQEHIQRLLQGVQRSQRMMLTFVPQVVSIKSRFLTKVICNQPFLIR